MEKAKKLILFIESNQDLIKIYLDVLKVDFEISTLGQDALAKIENIKEGKDKKPNLIMLDLKLSDIDGTEVLKNIKDNETTKNIPVLVLSNRAIEELPELNLSEQDKFTIYPTLKIDQMIELIEKMLK
jgi:CheY-like chemotaxis protein